jgi:hypothetical protein
VIDKHDPDVTRGSPTKQSRGFLHRSKDATLAFTARVAINKWLNSIGEMTELSIDTKNKRIWIRLELVGESEPIEIQILRYNLKTEGGTAHITIEEIAASREWLTAALNEFVVGQNIPIPPKAVALLRLLM